MTTWPARRVGDALLCGRPVPHRGHCTGLLAIVNETATGPVAWLPFGMIEDPDDPGFWRPSSRAKDQRARGQVHPQGHALRAGRRRHLVPVIESHIPVMPWRRRCPDCNVVALVTADLLHDVI